MHKLDRYIVSTVSSAILVVMLIVLSLDFLFAYIGEMDELRGRYQSFEAFLYVCSTLPRRIYDYLPLGAFMGCLVGLGALAKNSELTVLRAAGVSTIRIVYAAMKSAFVVVFFGLLLGEFVAPLTEKIAQSQKAVAQGAESDIGSHQGLWHREGHVFMHFNVVESNGVLHGVMLQFYDDDRALLRTVFAGRALYQRGGWLLESVIETRFENGRTNVEEYVKLAWDTDLTPSLLDVLIVKPDNLSISGLYAYAEYLGDQGLSSAEYMVSFWKKLLQPVSTLMLVLVAISFVFGPLRSVTMGFRVFLGVVVGLSFKYVQDLLGPMSLVFGFNPVYATLIPILVCMCLGMMLLLRSR